MSLHDPHVLARSSLPAGIDADVSAGSALELTASPDDDRAAVSIFHGAAISQAVAATATAAKRTTATLKRGRPTLDDGPTDQPPPAKEKRMSAKEKAKKAAAAAAAAAASVAAAAKDVEDHAVLDEAIAENERVLASSAATKDAAQVAPPAVQEVAQPTAQERRRKREREAPGTRGANGGEIKTDHEHMCAAPCLHLPSAQSLS